MGRHLTNSTTALHEPVTVTVTGEAVAVGDYVRVEASGAGRRAVDGLSLANQNTGPGVTAVAGLAATAYVAGGGYDSAAGRAARVLATLGSGNVACLYTGNGTTPSTGLTCRIYSPVKMLVTQIAVSAAASITSSRVIKLNASNFAVCWTESAVLKMAIYSNAGAVVQSALSVATVSNGSTAGWNAVALANGDLVMAYDKTGAGGVFFQRFSASGALQGAETTIEAATAGQYFCVLPLAAGGFWVYYFRSTATTAYKFVRYNASGVLQGALTTVFTGGASLSIGGYENYAIELSNGNVALIDPTSSTISAVRLYDSSGTFLTTVINQPSGVANAPNLTGIRAKAGGGFYICCFGGGLFGQYDNSGALVQWATAPVAWTTSFSFVLIDRVGTGPVLVYWGDSSGSGAFIAGAYDSTLTLEATALFILNSPSAVTYGGWAELMPCGLIAYTFTNSTITGSVVHGRVAPQAASVLGVAVSAGTDGQSIQVATAGRWRANQTMPSLTFDRRNSTPVGCKATITGGTQTVLLGITA